MLLGDRVMDTTIRKVKEGTISEYKAMVKKKYFLFAIVYHTNYEATSDQMTTNGNFDNYEETKS